MAPYRVRSRARPRRVAARLRLALPVAPFAALLSSSGVVAVSRCCGGTTHRVALEAARNLKFGDIVVSTRDIDFLDISGMATKLGLPPEKK